MILQMPAGELLVGGSTLQTRNRKSANTLPPINGRWWRLDGTGGSSLLLRFECHQTGVGLLESFLHTIW